MFFLSRYLRCQIVKGWFALPPTRPEVRSFRGVSDVGFSSCAAPTYYSVSKYFVQESGSAEIYFWGPEIQKRSVSLKREERRVEIIARVFPEAWELRLRSPERRPRVDNVFSSRYSRCRIHT